MKAYDTLSPRGRSMNQLSKRLQKAVEAAKTWSADRQEAAADLLEQMNRLESTPYELTEDERADIEEALEEVRRGQFASDAEVAALFARYGS
jgi:SOS response regulatory protein OraA/RecX